MAGVDVIGNKLGKAVPDAADTEAAPMEVDGA